MLITATIAWPLTRANARFEGVYRGLRVASGVISLLFGAVIAYRIGVVDGLFSASPNWTPR
jgi:high-affinity nickel-transport protein